MRVAVEDAVEVEVEEGEGGGGVAGVEVGC